LKGYLGDTETKTAFEYIKSELVERGHVAGEQYFLKEISDKPAQENHLYFLMALGPDFQRSGENDYFHDRWTVNKAVQDHIEDSLLRLAKKLDEHPLPEDEIIARFEESLKENGSAFSETPKTVLMEWLKLSKQITKNPFGEWGLSDSPYVRPRGIRDLAYLFMRKHGSPMHFREVAGGIQKTLSRNAHHQTVHNELIKDNRFVLVGRGLYALTEWGYQPGIVRNVIQSILKKHGSLSREDLIKRVLKERHVKENTILINLQNKKYFHKMQDGKYASI